MILNRSQLREVVAILESYMDACKKTNTGLFGASIGRGDGDFLATDVCVGPNGAGGKVWVPDAIRYGHTGTNTQLNLEVKRGKEPVLVDGWNAKTFPL